MSIPPLQIRRVLAASLPTLAKSEPAFTDTFLLYIGDGATNHLIGGGSSYTADEVTLHLAGTVFSVISTYTGQVSITTLGTIATGTWQGTKVASAYGGTGADSSAATGIAHVTAGAWTFSAISTADIAANAVTAAKVGSDVVVTAGSNAFTGAQSMGGHALTNLADPVSPQDAVTLAMLMAQIGSAHTALANPSASVGLTAVNGSAVTAMRSDAAPPISQSIAPTWTGIHTFQFNGIGTSVSASNSMRLYNTTAATALAPDQYSPLFITQGKIWNGLSSSTVQFAAQLLTFSSIPATCLAISTTGIGTAYVAALYQDGSLSVGNNAATAGPLGAGVVNVDLGYMIGGTGPVTGHYLRGDGGGYFVDGTIQSADLPTVTLTGDVTGSGASGSIATTVAGVNGVAYGTSPATNTVPVVTGSNTVTYEAVPTAALAARGAPQLSHRQFKRLR